MVATTVSPINFLGLATEKWLQVCDLGLIVGKPDFLLCVSLPVLHNTLIKVLYTCLYTSQIYSLPEFNLVFVVRNFPMAQKVLVDSGTIQKTR